MFDPIKYRELMAQWPNVLPEGITRVVGFDTETFVIKNQVAPPVVCGTFYDPSREKVKGWILKGNDLKRELRSLLRDDSVLIVAHNVGGFDAVATCVFDKKLFPLWMRAFYKGRVACTKIREIMLLVGGNDNYGEVNASIIARHGSLSRSSLAGCLLNYTGKDISEGKKAGSWRYRYHELYTTPLDRWSPDAVDYAIGDAEYAVAIYIAQEFKNRQINDSLSRHYRRPINILEDAPRQAHAEFCLQFQAMVTGLGIDPTRVDNARDALMADHEDAIKVCNQFHVYKQDTKCDRGWKMDKGRLQAIFTRCYNILDYSSPDIYSDPSDPTSISTATDPRDKLGQMIKKALTSKKTPTTKKPLSETHLRELEVLMYAIDSVADCESLWKQINTFIEALRNARLNDDNRLRWSFNGLVATGRTSSKNPNTQNFPRGGDVRSCVVPKPGHIYGIVDYSNAEMRTLGQVNMDEQGLQQSKLAQEYIKDAHFDPHLFAGYQMYNIEQSASMTFEEAKAILGDKKHPDFKAIKKYRTLAKILNFGLAGGLSHVSFVSYARGYKVYLTIAESEKLCTMWKQVWSEMTRYFNIRGDLFREDPMTGEMNTTDAGRTYVFKQSGRARFLRKYTVAANTPFQGIAADGAKSAVIEVFKECYFEPSSPLYGCTPVLFIHDEIVVEIPYQSEADHQRASDAVTRLSEIMVEQMEKYTPDIPAVAEANLSTMWTKDAESTVDANGLVSIWTPSEDDVEEDEGNDFNLDASDRDLANNNAQGIYDNYFSAAAKKQQRLNKGV